MSSVAGRGAITTGCVASGKVKMNFVLFSVIFALSTCIIDGQFDSNSIHGSLNHRIKYLFQPLRIFPFYKNLNLDMNSQDSDILKETIENVILYLKRLFSVIRENKNLILKRDACQSSWQSGRNAGKCSTIRKGYAGEFCSSTFAIPDEHLEGFYTWKNNKPLPDRTWYMEGDGIKNADFVIYVQAIMTKPCMENYEENAGSNLLAYSSSCQFNKNGRPVAGYLNFCPSEVHKHKHDKQRLVLTTIHELLHALGFDKDMFYKFRDCRESFNGEDCPFWGFPVVRGTGDDRKLVTPAVVHMMQKHFVCRDRDFGGILKVRDGVLQSHWDEDIHAGSIMTSFITDPSLTFVDPITLAVFQDSGWYQVNFSNADTYLWGQGKGCDFVKQFDRFQNTEECLSSNNETGCNYLYTHTVSCTKTGEITEVKEEEDCTIHKYNSLSASSAISVHPTLKHNEHGRCMLSNLTAKTHQLIHITETSDNTKYGGICVTVKCLNNGELWFKINSSNWIYCPLGEQVEVPSYIGVVFCPEKADGLCRKDNEPLYLQNLTHLETTTLRNQPHYRATPRSYDWGSDDGGSYGRDGATNLSFCYMLHVLTLAILTLK